MPLFIGDRKVEKGCKVILRDCTIAEVTSDPYFEWDKYEVSIKGQPNRYYDLYGVCMYESRSVFYTYNFDDLDDTVDNKYREFDILGVLYS